MDALFLLEWSFTMGDVPPDPSPGSCGFDLTNDDIDCETDTCDVR